MEINLALLLRISIQKSLCIAFILITYHSISSIGVGCVIYRHLETFPFLILITRSAIGVSAGLCVMTITVVPVFCMYPEGASTLPSLSGNPELLSAHHRAEASGFFASALAMELSAAHHLRAAPESSPYDPQVPPASELSQHPVVPCRSVPQAPHSQVL